MRLTKALGAAGALIVAALVGGTLISSTLAQTDGDNDTNDDGTSLGSPNFGEYCDVLTETFAAELGVSVDDLLPAGKAAAIAAVDAAVEAGDLDADRAETLKERIEQVDDDACSFIGPWHRGFAAGLGAGALRGFGHGFVAGDAIDAAAEVLGLDGDDLLARLAAAGSLEALAEELGVSYDEVKASVLATVQADLDTAVAEGLSQERADAVIERLTSWLDEGGELGGLHPGRGQ